MPNIENKKWFLESVLYTIIGTGLLMLILFLWLAYKLTHFILQFMKKITIFIWKIINYLIYSWRINYVLNSESINSKSAFLVFTFIMSVFILFYLSIFINNMNILFLSLKNELQYINWHEIFGLQYLIYGEDNSTNKELINLELDMSKPVLNSSSSGESESDSDSESVKSTESNDSNYSTNTNGRRLPWIYDKYTPIPRITKPQLPEPCQSYYIDDWANALNIRLQYGKFMDNWAYDIHNGHYRKFWYPKHPYWRCFDCCLFAVTDDERIADIKMAQIREKVRWANLFDYKLMEKWEGRSSYLSNSQALVCTPKDWPRIKNTVLMSADSIGFASRIDTLDHKDLDTLNQGILMSVKNNSLDITVLPSGRSILHKQGITNRPVFVNDEIPLKKIKEAIRILEDRNPYHR